MAKVKKSPEEKLVAQIDKLLKKQGNDNTLVEKLNFQNAANSQTTDIGERKTYNETADLIEEISTCVQRRSRLLKRKGEKLSKLRTQSLGITP